MKLLKRYIAPLALLAVIAVTSFAAITPTVKIWYDHGGDWQRIRDTGNLYFGNSDDIDIEWDGTTWNIEPLADDTVMNIGNGTLNIDVKIFGSTADNFLYWDASANVLYPAADDTVDMGKIGNEFQDGYFDGTLNADTLVADSATISAGSLTMTTGTFTAIVIGANTLDTNEWAFLDGQDQAVGNGDSPTFSAGTFTTIVIGANTISTTEWAFLDGQDQAVATTDNVTFGNLTATTITIGANAITTTEWAFLDGIDQSVATTDDVTHADITATSLTIGANVLTTTEWAFLDGIDQAVATTDTPSFAGLTIGSGDAMTKVLHGTVDIANGATSATITSTSIDADDVVILTWMEDPTTYGLHALREAGIGVDVIMDDQNDSGGALTVSYVIIED